MRKRSTGLIGFILTAVMSLQMFGTAAYAAVGGSIDYEKETLSVITSSQFTSDTSDETSYITAMWDENIDIGGGYSAIDFGKTVYYRSYIGEKDGVSEYTGWKEIDIPKRPATPSVKVSDSGMLEGTSADMEYKEAGGSAWTDCGGATVGPLKAGTYQVRVKASSTKKRFASEICEVTVTGGVSVLKPQDAPSSPELESRTETSITLKAVKPNGNGTASQYRIDGGKWQSGTKFSGLESDTQYMFEARYGAADGFEASNPSELVIFRTKAAKKSGGYSLAKSESGSTDRQSAESRPEEDLIFADVAKDNPGYEAIMNAYEKGYMAGVSDGVFAPGGYLKRGMAAQILWNTAGNPKASGQSPFADVEEDEYYSEAVAWAYEQGIILGYDSMTFGPDDYVTVEQFEIMAAKYKGEEVPEYTGNLALATRVYVAEKIMM